MRLLPANAQVPILRNQALIGAALFLIAILVGWQVAGQIVSNDTLMLILFGVGFAGCFIAFTILRNWRVGLYWFLGWLTFEDFARKYSGNGLVLFFGKDVLAALVYIALFIAIRHKKEKLFRPPFLIFLSLFFWLGVLQVFNQYSPSIFYGLLGIKTYFYYIPLMYVGYAFVRSDEDLRKFLTWNMVLAGIVAVVGIAQAILGNSFMNPTTLAPDLRELGDLEKVTPISGQVFNLPDSVFVSSGRYGEYLTLAAIVAFGVAGYLLLTSKRGRMLAFIVTGLLGTAALLSGSRGTFLWVFGSAVILPMAFLWGAPWRYRQARRMVKAIRWSAALFCLGLVIFFAAFPEAMGARMDYYSETLLPSSSSYQLSNRTWSYPIANLEAAFTLPNWVVGDGIGTASLGGQYVEKLTGKPMQNVWVEEGYGELIVEMGILAPFLWLLWTGALLYYGWKVVRGLRQTRFFPIAFAILFYAFLLLYPLTYGNLDAFENYTNNAYLWLLVGVLFRLPELEQAVPTVAVFGTRKRSSGGLQF
ncbi:MAG TPA: hypothetical protein VMB47_06895 [Candidatus Aquilonibacter sp.]|nr:hypothetical protein [Candidatus Aquilonibacter sp.]